MTLLEFIIKWYFQTSLLKEDCKLNELDWNIVVWIAWQASHIGQTKLPYEKKAFKALKIEMATIEICK